VTGAGNAAGAAVKPFNLDHAAEAGLALASLTNICARKFSAAVDGAYYTTTF
jgi:hypothetical protein